MGINTRKRPTIIGGWTETSTQDCVEGSTEMDGVQVLVLPFLRLLFNVYTCCCCCWSVGRLVHNINSCAHFNGKLCSMHIQLKREAEIMISFNCHRAATATALPLSCTTHPIIIMPSLFTHSYAQIVMDGEMAKLVVVWLRIL